MARKMKRPEYPVPQQETLETRAATRVRVAQFEVLRTAEKVTNGSEYNLSGWPHTTVKVYVDSWSALVNAVNQKIVAERALEEIRRVKRIAQEAFESYIQVSS